MYITYTQTEQLKKVRELENAAMSCSPDEISEVYKKLGGVEFTARALGLACRFRGVDCVRALVEGGATFDTPTLKRDEQLFHAYSRKKRDFNHSDFSAYLLNIGKRISGSCCCKGMKFTKSVKRGGKVTLRLLSDDERAEVLKYLCANRQKISFKPWELLLYAIFARDDFIFGELKKLGVKLSEKRVKVIAEGGAAVDGYWREYRSMTNGLSAGDFIPVMERLFGELGGVKFHCTEKMFEALRERFSDPKTAEFFAGRFDTDKLNKLKILRGAVDENNIPLLSLGERLGWLANTKRRDTLMEYAAENGKTECSAWLLDFKNRTADLAAEQAKAEKKQLRELNASPDSVTALRALWSWGKREDGTLVIKRYKGERTEITIPKMIGRSIVTAIGSCAFSPNYPKLDEARIAFLKTIKRVTLPDTITSIGKGAFHGCEGLAEINIPEGVEVIGAKAFEDCGSLERVCLPNGITELAEGVFFYSGIGEIHIPDSVKRIGENAFRFCKNLKEITFPDSVAEIGGSALSGCSNLESVRLPNGLSEISGHLLEDCEKLPKINIPDSVKRIGNGAFFSCMGLSEIHIPDGVREIGAYAFSFCSGIGRIVLPNGITDISDHLFHGCKMLREIRLPEGIKSIGDVAFASCEELKEVVVPDGVVSIGRQAFEACLKLRTIVLPSSIKQIANTTVNIINSHDRPILTILAYSRNAVAVVLPNSYAELYCKESAIPYTYQGGNEK